MDDKSLEELLDDCIDEYILGEDKESRKVLNIFYLSLSLSNQPTNRHPIHLVESTKV